MATTNHERVGKALDLLKAGLGPFVDRELQGAIKAKRVDVATLRRFVDDPQIGDRPATEWDVAALLKLMWETWNDVFRAILGPAERGFVGELRGQRNRWAHQEPFSGDDATARSIPRAGCWRPSRRRRPPMSRSSSWSYCASASTSRRAANGASRPGLPSRARPPAP